MGSRLELQTVLENVMTSLEKDPNVYFQPPATVRMNYPCIVYTLDNVNTIYADNYPYRHVNAYAVMVIDKDPDSVIPSKIADLKMSSFKTKYVRDNLHHTVYELYF